MQNHKQITSGYVITIAIVFFALSCSDTIKKERQITINLLEKKHPINYSLFVDSIRYIPLETSEECLVGQIKDIIRDDSLLFILDKKADLVYVFNHAGKYLSKLDQPSNFKKENPTILIMIIKS